MKISAGSGGNVSPPWGCGKADALLGLKRPCKWSRWPRRFVWCLDFRCCHRVPEKEHWTSKKSAILWVLLFKIYGSGYIFLINLFLCIYLAVPSCGCGMRTLSCSMWNWFPDQGSNPGPLHWEHRVLATGPPGKSPGHTFKLTSLFSEMYGTHEFCLSRQEKKKTWTLFFPPHTRWEKK